MKVTSWLGQEWKPRARKLIVFGPSAGWTLPKAFIESFEEILCVEPDPLARWLFRRRFERALKNHGALNFIPDAGLLPWTAKEPEAFSDFIQAHSEHAILFSNILGQLALLPTTGAKTVSTAEARRTFLATLEGREWASYHDLLSSSALPSISEAHTSLNELSLPFAKTDSTKDDFGSIRGMHESGHSLPDKRSIESVAASLFRHGTEVIDHETLWLSEGRPTQLALWRLSPAQNHVVAFVHSPNRP